MDRVDITMTAVIRPKMLAGTLRTIQKNIIKNQTGFRLIINIDPIGESKNPMKVVDIAKTFFSDVVYNIAKKPSFAKAVKWVWSQAEAPYVFHWEDDIDILRPIDIDDMISIHEKYPKLSSLRLYKHPTPKKKVIDTFGCRWIYKPEGFYMSKDWKKQFGLNPILIKKAFIDGALKCMVDNVNPEKQFRFSQPYMRQHIKNWQYGLYTKQGAARIIDGRKGQAWKNNLKLQKPRGQTFVRWEKK